MEKKQVPEMLVAKCSISTTLQTLTQDVDKKPQQLVELLLQNRMEIAGPQVWIYKGADGNMTTQFQLEICQPIVELKEPIEGFEFVTLPRFQCCSKVHKGEWSKLGDFYCQIFGEIAQQKFVPSGISREVYLNCDFENQSNNLTEVQIGIE